jgi:acetyltransferase-like isoleucine patch superfamily enzyme
MELQKVQLGNNLWIGTHAVIMSDVASDTVVGAGAVVTKLFAPSTVIAGVPAKVIRGRGKI